MMATKMDYLEVTSVGC